VNSSVVEPVDVVEGCPFDMFDVVPGALAMNQFALVETIEVLREGIDASIVVKPRFGWCFQLG
jgi:hypothetical protein